MKEVRAYECEICEKIYHQEGDCRQCEKLGKEDYMASIGDVVKYKVRVGGGFDPFYVEMRVKSIEDKGHYLVYNFEEYDEDEGVWSDSSYVTSGIWGNEEFEKLCETVID